MSVYSRILNQRVTKAEVQLATTQEACDANRPNVLHDVLAEGYRVLQPCMWDWILETTVRPLQQDRISRIACMLAFDQGWDLTGGWREAPRYWWILKGCRFCGEKLNTDGLFYFFQCSRADFSALPLSVQDHVWQEAVMRLTALLRKPELCELNAYRPEEARLFVAALSDCNLPQLLRPHLPITKGYGKGSKEAFVTWLNAEYRRQYAKRGIIK
ncbi:MAG: hypothetical protein H8K03_11200 [Nitrospira sp.]